MTKLECMHSERDRRDRSRSTASGSLSVPDEPDNGKEDRADHG